VDSVLSRSCPQQFSPAHRNGGNSAPTTDLPGVLLNMLTDQVSRRAITSAAKASDYWTDTIRH
jgi:hypothetical protein